MYFSLFIHALVQRQAQALSVKSWGRGWQVQAQHTKEQDNGNFAIPIEQQGCLHKNEQLQDIEGWRLAINRSSLSTKKAWILQTIRSLHTSDKFINQSQYQKYSYSTQLYFWIIFLRVLQTTISHSLSSLKVVIRSKHQISYWLYILKPVKSWVIV